MAQKRRFLDVWIVESNTVYREVPYEVVVDWVQQGRLLEDDNLRWSGQAEWFRLGGMPAFAAYMPRSDPMRAEDQAEALEQVEVDFAWHRPHDAEEDDPDMIPLIDVTLVLLIFFMMTASAAVAYQINTPPTDNGTVTSDQGIVWVGLDFTKRDAQGNPLPNGGLTYAVGQGDKTDGTRDVANTDRDREEGIQWVLEQVEKKPGGVEVNIRADTDIPSGYVRDLMKALERIRAKVTRKYIGVSEKSP